MSDTSASGYIERPKVHNLILPEGGRICFGSDCQSYIGEYDADQLRHNSQTSQETYPNVPRVVRGAEVITAIICVAIIAVRWLR